MGKKCQLPAPGAGMVWPKRQRVLEVSTGPWQSPQCSELGTGGDRGTTRSHPGPPAPCWIQEGDWAGRGCVIRQDPARGAGEAPGKTPPPRALPFLLAHLLFFSPLHSPHPAQHVGKRNWPMTARHLPHGSGDGIRADGKHPKLFLVCQQLEATWWERSRRGPGALAAPWGQCHPPAPALPHTRPRVPAAPRAAPRPAPGSAPPALPLPCPRLCQQLTPSGCRIRPSPAVWTSARAGECCRGWEERSGHRCSRLRGADAGCVASGSATAPGDFPLSYLLLTWKNTLGAASSPAPQAGRWVGKSPRHPWAGGCEGRRRPPPVLPHAALPAGRLGSTQRPACVSHRGHVHPAGTAPGTHKGCIAGS